jgi:hypothetical protein
VLLDFRFIYKSNDFLIIAHCATVADVIRIAICREFDEAVDKLGAKPFRHNPAQVVAVEASTFKVGEMR